MILVSRRPTRHGTVAVFKGKFEDGHEAVLQVSVSSEHYTQQSYVRVQPLAGDTWGDALVFIDGDHMSSARMESDHMAGRMRETYAAMRERGCEDPHRTLRERY